MLPFLIRWCPFQIDISVNVGACYVKVEDDGMCLPHVFYFLLLGFAFRRTCCPVVLLQVVVLLEMNWFSWEKNMVSQNSELFLFLFMLLLFPHSAVSSTFFRNTQICFACLCIKIEIR